MCICICISEFSIQICIINMQQQLLLQQTTTDLLPITRFLHDVATVRQTIEKLLRLWRLVEHVIWRHSKHLHDLHYLIKLQHDNTIT